MHREPIVITAIDGPGVDKEHTRRNYWFAATCLDEFYFEKIIGYSGSEKNPKKLKFRVRWLKYEPEDYTILDWSEVKGLAALDEYS